MKALLKALIPLRGSTTVPAASFDDIEYIMGELYESDYMFIAKDYIKFLYATNGFLWNGMEFYGTHSVEVGNYDMPNLYEANENFEAMYPGLHSKLLVGKMDDDLFVYEGILNKYEILDRADRAVMESFDCIEDMIRKLIQIPK